MHKFGWKYVEQETSLLQMISAGPPPEPTNHLQQVPIQYLSQLSLPAPSHWSLVNNTAHQQRLITTVGAIPPRYTFQPPSPMFDSKIVNISSITDTAARHASPYTPLSTLLGAKRKRWDEPIPPEAPMTVLSPPQSLPFKTPTSKTSKTTLSHRFEPNYSKYTNLRPIPISPTVTSSKSTGKNSVRAPSLAQPSYPSSLLMSINAMTSKSENNKHEKIVSKPPSTPAPRSPLINVARAQPKSPPPPVLPQTLITNHISKTMMTYALDSNFVVTDVKTKSKQPRVDLSSVISLSRELPTALPSPPPTPPQAITRKMSKGTDLVAKTTEVKFDNKPPIISLRRSSGMSVAREIPTAPSPPPSPQTLAKNSLFTKNMGERKPPSVISGRSSLRSVARASPKGLLASPSPQLQTVNKKVSPTMTSFTSSSDFVGLGDKTNSELPTMCSPTSTVTSLGEFLTTMQRSSSPPFPLVLPQTPLLPLQSLTTTSYSVEPSSIATQAKTEVKSQSLPPIRAISPPLQSFTIHSRIANTPDSKYVAAKVKSQPNSPTVASPVAQPPPLPPLPPLALPPSLLPATSPLPLAKNTMTSKLVTTFTSNNEAIEAKTEWKSPSISSTWSPFMSLGEFLTALQRPPPPPPPPSLSPSTSPHPLSQQLLKDTSYSSDPNFRATKVTSDLKPQTVVSPKSPCPPQSLKILKTISDLDFAAEKIKSKPKSPTAISPRSPVMSIARASLLASPAIAPPPPPPPLPPTHPPPLPPTHPPPQPSSQSLTTNTMISEFTSHHDIAEKPSSLKLQVTNIRELLTTLQPPPPPPLSPSPQLPPASQLPQSLTTSYSYDPSFFDTEGKTERKSQSLASPRSPSLPPQSLTILETMSSTSNPNFISVEIKSEPNSPTTASPKSPALTEARASPLTTSPIYPPLPPASNPPLSPPRKSLKIIDPNFIATEIKIELNPQSLISPRSPSYTSDPNFKAVEVKTESISPTESFPSSPLPSTRIAPPPPLPPPLPPHPPPPPLLYAMISENSSYTSDPNSTTIEVKTEPKSPTAASPISPVMSILQDLPKAYKHDDLSHTELSRHLVTIKRKSDDDSLLSAMNIQSVEIIDAKRLKMESPLEESVTRVKEEMILQSSQNKLLKADSSASPEIVTPISMGKSMDAASVDYVNESSTPTVPSLTWPSASLQSPWADIPWETIQQILSQKPPPPPTENIPEILKDKNSDKCGDRCLIEKFLLYETVAHQTSLLRDLAISFQKEPDCAAKNVGAKACASVLAYL
ncbi:unnamed protein product [Spodoptera exigua]|nr:unnamed protein product [Spodoptera exigua]